jgi:TRAP-type transport system small permease protein
MNGPNPSGGDSSARLLTWLLRGEQMLAVGLLLLVLVTMGVQVIARYVFHAPISWSEELARFGLIWLAFISSAFVMAEGQHLTVDMLSARLGPAGKLRLDCFSNVMVIITCLLLLVGGFRFVWRVAPVGSPGLGIPMSWWYGAASTGLALVALHAALNMRHALRTGRPVWIDHLPGQEEMPIRPKGME